MARVHVTPEAWDLVRRSIELAGRAPDEVGVRLRVAGGAVRPRFVTGPEPGDVLVEAEGIRLFVAKEIVQGRTDVEVAVSSEHETLVVR